MGIAPTVSLAGMAVMPLVFRIGPSRGSPPFQRPIADATCRGVGRQGPHDICFSVSGQGERGTSSCTVASSF